MRIRAFILRHRVAVAAAALLAGAALVFVLVWLQPQKLFIETTVDEALPEVPTAATTSPPSSPDATNDAPSASPAPAATPRVIAGGRFRSLEHASSGRALVIELATGERFLRFEDLDTSNGPDLRVYLSVLPSDRGWYDYDDARFVDLGALKGNRGNQNYRVPADIDVESFRSAVIWCRRFSVGFAVAPLD